MRVWLMVTMMALVVATAAVIVACGGDGEEEAPQVPVWTPAPVETPVYVPAERPIDKLYAQKCQQAQAKVTDLQLEVLKRTRQLRDCPDTDGCATRHSREGLLESAERKLEQALREVLRYCR